MQDGPNMLWQWMRAATADEQELLAVNAGTTRGHLYQVSNGHRYFSPEKAADVARESEKMHRASGKRLPILYVTDLADACAKCQYAQKCLGSAAVRADFSVVTPESLSR
jgi:hypothetical protein